MNLFDSYDRITSPSYGLLAEEPAAPPLQVSQPQHMEQPPNFDLSPTLQQQKQAAWASIGNMGAAMLMNNRGGFANALGHGLAAQQQGYRGALDRAQDDNVQQFRTSALKDDWQAKQQQRQQQAALQQAMKQIDWTQPGAHKSAAQLLVQAGDYDGAKNVLALDPSMANSKRFGTIVNGADGMMYQVSEGGLIPTGVKAGQNLQYVAGPDGAPLSYNRSTGTALPVMKGGAPVPAPAPKLKDMPPAVLTGISENRAFIGNLNELIASLDPKTPDSPARKALGGKNYIGGTKIGQDLINSQDPAGVDTRSKIANVASKLIHDRSGAAVTASEQKNLTPFLPQLTDAPDVARQKLQKLREYVNNELKALLDTYSSTNGYKGIGQEVPRPQVDISSIPPGAIDKLKRNYKLGPKATRDFDEMYGAGASQYILGQ